MKPRPAEFWGSYFFVIPKQSESVAIGWTSCRVFAIILEAFAHPTTHERNQIMINISGYRITQQIYESANSLVYRGLRNKDNQAVILKVLKENYPTPEELTRYRLEYDITRRLTDLDGIVTAYSLEKNQNTLVMCLEDFGGESLRTWLDEQRAFTLDELLAFAGRAAGILGQIHRKNIIHKDINPSNIILNPASGVLKIIDFGISTQLSKQHLTLKNPDVLEGTLAYISPEQTGRMNRALDYRSDFYSLGAAFYELFTGKTPFESEDAMELVHCHIARQPVPPQQINPDLPGAVSDIILKLLEKTAEARYQSAWGIKADLEKCKAALQKTGTIEAFALAQKDISDRFQITQKLYGREHEVDALLSAFEQAADGKAEIMLVAGYSGIGKSVLVKEIYQSLTKKQGYFISGKFDQFQHNIPYSALINAFRELVQQLFTESETQLTQWKRLLLNTLGPNGQIIIDVIPEIELIIGKQAAVPSLGPAESQNRFNLVFQNFIRVFCQPKHPLVIFLDDLQWVDSATLKLLELVTTDKESAALFLIGAYRDNEVDPTHPLLTTLDKLRKESVTVNQIVLRPLTFEHINQLIGESLHYSLKAVSSLTDLVMRKTGGNPFFINQFLHTLYEENLLHFIPPTLEQKGHWQWDISRIETLNITDNVVELMVGKLKKLPESAQQVLRLAACAGNRFDLDALSVIYEKSVSDTFQDLMPVLTEGLILPLSELEMAGTDIRNSQFIIHHLQFLHDRVQQAAYALIDNEQKQAVHLQIGRLLLESTHADTLEEKVFDIAGHFNHSIELLDNQAERLAVARLNLMAGQKAKMATAYGAAVSYLTIGRECLTENSWENEYELAFNLFAEAAGAASLSGDFKQMGELAQAVLRQAKTLSDEVKIREIQISAYIPQNQERKAIKIALDFLNRLGIDLPEEPTQKDVGLALQKVQVSLSGQPIQSFIDLPMMTDTHMILAMRIMMAVSSPAYHVAPRLMVLLLLKQVELSFKYGNVSESSFSYVGYGFILCGVAGDIESGYQFGRLALDLLERSGEKGLKARVIFLFNDLVRPWKEHVRKTIQPFLESYQLGLETGDLEFAAYSVFYYPFYSYFIGKQLVALEQEMALYSHAVARLKQEGVLNRNNLFWQVVLNLMGHSDNPCRLSGKVYDEDIQLPLHLQVNERTSIHYLHLNKCILHYLFQEYAAAVENAEIARQYLDGVTSQLVVPIFHFYDSLARLALYPGLPRQQQDAILTQVSGNQEKMKQWAHHAPMNFQHKFYLVEAECARVQGKDGDAREFYDQAITLAHKNEYINEEALAYEVAGRFYLRKGKPKLAQVYLRDAHYAYSRWGALAKTRALETRYPDILAQTSAGSATAPAAAISSGISIMGTSREEVSGSLDLISILKASQTIAGEIELKRLLEKQMKIVIENAGAQRGVLILDKNGRWVIEAEGAVDKEEVAVLQSVSIEEDNFRLPSTLVNYVIHARESVVLHDAAREGQFSLDPYVARHQTKSALCTPLLNHGKLTGVFYLENNLAEGVFTPRRLEVLELLSAQIAVSIENADFYAELERKVDERTRELHEKNESLVLLNQEKNEFLGIAAHDLKNPLAGIKGMAEAIADTEEGLSAEVAEYAEMIHVSARKMFVLITNLLDVNAIESGKLNLSLKATDIRPIVEELSRYYAERAKSKHITVEFQCEAGPHHAMADENTMHQILDNLISNAVKYSPANKGITIRLRRHERNLRCEVEDQGPGLSKADQKKLFGKFTRLSAQPTGGEHSTGLGLFNVKKLTEAMHGRVWCKSELGRGAAFIVEFPGAAAEEIPPPPEKTPACEAPPVKTKELRILVAEDNPVNRKIALLMFKKLGYRPDVAEDGQEVLELLEKQHYDIIFMDIHMPRLDGLAATRRIVEDYPQAQRPYIVALTAGTAPEEKQKCFDAGMQAYINKPFKKQVLEEVLSQYSHP